MSVSIKNHTNKYIVIAILVVMALWAALFYAVLMDEVYDNIDDGLKNQKILIIREAYKNPTLLENSKEFGVNQFIIYPADPSDVVDVNNFSKEFIYMPYDGEQEPYRVLRTGFYSVDGQPFHLELRTSTVEEDDFLVNLGISLVVLYIVLLLSIFIINYYVLGRAWQPFNKILQHLDNYRFGDGKKFEPVNTQIAEFSLLTNHIQTMLLRNEQVFNQQKLFLENASHELQTPLAVTLNKLALMLEDDSLNDTQISKIVEIKSSLHRMVNLNKSLLMLSRIDNQQYGHIESVVFNSVIRTIVEDLEDVISFKNITLECEESNYFIVDINPDLAHILFSNLLRNALKYNIPDGIIKIHIHSDKVDIMNSSGVGALNPAYIFERFYKGNQDNMSNGLGLSIVKSILNIYPYLDIQYEYIQNMHKFSVQNLKTS